MSDKNRFSKLAISLQHYLHGARYYDALKAYDFARSIHTGFRKDGVTPEFQHQIEIALFITTLRDVQDEEGTIIAALLHDVLEDYPHITVHELENMFGVERTQSVVVLSKEINQKVRYDVPEEYFGPISLDVRASIVKGCDRIHNLRTMVGVFTTTKQQHYVQETKYQFLPMLKTADGQFPRQHMAYMNIRTMLKTQMELVQHILGATQE